MVRWDLCSRSVKVGRHGCDGSKGQFTCCTTLWLHDSIIAILQARSRQCSSHSPLSGCAASLWASLVLVVWGNRICCPCKDIAKWPAVWALFLPASEMATLSISCSLSYIFAQEPDYEPHPKGFPLTTPFNKPSLRIAGVLTCWPAT